MCKEESNQEAEIEEEYSEVEQQMQILGLNEEIDRMELQHNPISKASKETKNSDFYKENMIIAETIGELFQRLLGYGIDYNNSVSISNNIYQNNSNERLAKIQQAIQEQNQP